MPARAGDASQQTAFAGYGICQAGKKAAPKFCRCPVPPVAGMGQHTQPLNRGSLPSVIKRPRRFFCSVRKGGGRMSEQADLLVFLAGMGSQRAVTAEIAYLEHKGRCGQVQGAPVQAALFAMA